MSNKPRLFLLAILSVSLPIGCREHPNLVVRITGVSVICPSEGDPTKPIVAGDMITRVVYMPNGSEASLADNVTPNHAGYIIPPHRAFVRAPAANLAAESRCPDFFFEDYDAMGRYEQFLTERRGQQSTLADEPPLKLTNFAVWLLDGEQLDFEAKVEPFGLGPTRTVTPTVEHVAFLGAICCTSTLVEEYLPNGDYNQVTAQVNLPAGWLTEAAWQISPKKWSFCPGPEYPVYKDAPPPPAKQLAREVYSKWRMKSGTVKLVSHLMQKKGTPPITPPPKPIVLTERGSDLHILIGNAPLDDIIMQTTYDEALDTHFELYYLLTGTWPHPIDRRERHHWTLPHVPKADNSEGQRLGGLHGHNCPPLLASGTSPETAAPERRSVTQYTGELPCDPGDTMNHMQRRVRECNRSRR